MNDQVVEVFKALGDPIRFKIYQSVRQREVCACDFLRVLDLDISQPTLSFHLKKLVGCGLILERKEGVFKHYRVNENLIKEIVDIFK